jgi:hypothetical protein
VGIIQTVLNAAVESQDLDAGAEHLSLVQGDVMAQSILPIIAAHDEPTAKFIEDNMVVIEGVDTVKDGAQAVADRFGYYITTGANLPCSYVGSAGGVNPCAKYGSSASIRSGATWLTLTCILGAASILL